MSLLRNREIDMCGMGIYWSCLHISVCKLCMCGCGCLCSCLLFVCVCVPLNLWLSLMVGLCERLTEKEHCAGRVFSWWVQLVSHSPPHGACSRVSKLPNCGVDGTRDCPVWTVPVTTMHVAQREYEGHTKYVIKI